MSVSLEQIEAEYGMSAQELQRLGELEAVIDRGVRSFVDVGRALREVQESRLYRDGYPTFEAYLSARWDLKRQRAYELIDAAKIHELVSETSDTPPSRESHAAALAPLRDRPEKLVEVWEAAARQAQLSDRPVTASDVRAARQRLAEPHPASLAPPEPPPAPAAAPAGDMTDLRFAQIEEAVQLLQILPAPEQIVWPTDDGDVQAVDVAVKWLAEYVPRLAREWREHQRTQRRLRAV